MRNAISAFKKHVRGTCQISMARMLRTCFGAVMALAFLLVSPMASSAYTVDTTSSPSALTGLWWNQNESGWGASLTQQYDVFFVAMYVYDQAGNPTWYVASNCTVSGSGCQGILYKVTGGAMPTSTWNGTNSATSVGTITLMFTDNNTGTMNYTINGVTGSKAIARQVWRTAPPVVTPNPGTLTLKATIPLNVILESLASVKLDGNKVIIVGGATARDVSSTAGGSPLFSNKVSVISLDTTSTVSYTLSSGRNTGTIVHKLAEGKYLITGGYQYVATADLLDINAGITTISTDLAITDASGLNTTPFYANSSGQAVVGGGKVVFFGYNNGLYGSGKIAIFNPTVNSFKFSKAQLSSSRSNSSAYHLSDGRIIIVGGWDTTALTTPDSATRRVDIYNPVSDSLVRVADSPEPGYAQNTSYYTGNAPTNSDAIRIGNYTYSISNNQWIANTNWPGTQPLTSSNYTYTSASLSCVVGQNCSIAEYSSIGGEFSVSYFNGYFIGATSTGDLVFLQQGRFSSTFDSVLNGYPIQTPDNIVIYGTN